MLQVLRNPLENEMRNENANRLVRLMETYLPVNETTGRAMLCNYGLVHLEDDDSYWHGSTFALSLADMTGSTVIDQTIPGFQGWDVGYAILETRQWFELTVEALDNLVHNPDYYFQAGHPDATHTLEYQHTERAHWTYVRLNSFLCWKSLSRHSWRYKTTAPCRSTDTTWADSMTNSTATFRHSCSTLCITSNSFAILTLVQPLTRYATTWCRQATRT